MAHVITCASWKYTGCEAVIATCTNPDCPEDGDHYDGDRLCSHCDGVYPDCDYEE